MKNIRHHKGCCEVRVTRSGSRDEAIWQAVQARRAAKPQTLLPEELPL